jgi:hypothetical protein
MVGGEKLVLGLFAKAQAVAGVLVVVPTQPCTCVGNPHVWHAWVDHHCVALTES